MPVPAVAARIPDTRGHTCVHYRAFGGSVDTANGQIFAATRNLAARFTTLIAAMPPGLPLFVASSSAEVTRSMLAAALRRGGGGAPAVPGSAQADDADSRAVFVAEWLALGRCARLLGTAGSSFSEEAAVAAGIVKEEVTEEPAAAAGRITAEPARVVEPSRRASATESVTVVTPAADHFADYLAGSVRVGRARCSSGACRAVIAAATAAAPTAAPTAANAAATTHASGTTTPPTTAAATAPAAAAAAPTSSTTSTAACGVGAAEEEDEQHTRVAIDADARRDASASAAGGGEELARSAEGEELAAATAAVEGRGAREVEGRVARQGVDEEHMHLQGWTGRTIGRDGTAAAEAAPEVAREAAPGTETDSEMRSRSRGRLRGRPEAAPEAAPGATPAHWESPMARYKRLNKPVG